MYISNLNKIIIIKKLSLQIIIKNLIIIKIFEWY